MIRIILAVAIGALCWILAIMIDLGIEAFHDLEGDHPRPTIVNVIDGFAPLQWTALIIGALTGVIAWKASEPLSASFQILILVLVLLLLAVATIGLVVIARHGIHLNGSRPVQWYRYCTNVALIGMLGVGVWRSLTKSKTHNKTERAIA